MTVVKFPVSDSMNHLNFGRVLLGGLVAGLILNAGEFLLNEVFFVKQLEETARRLNIARPGTSFNIIASTLTLFLGIMIVWLYASIRAQFGPGPKTAIMAALAAWFCIYLYAGILFAILTGVSPNLILIGLVWGLVEYTIAGVAGAWFYKES